MEFQMQKFIASILNPRSPSQKPLQKRILQTREEIQRISRKDDRCHRYSPGLGCCAPDFGNDSWGLAAALYGAVYAILGLALPAVLVTVCNLRVLGIARYHRHRIASAIYEVTLSAQATITHQRNPFFVPTVTAPSVVSPPRFHSAAKTVCT